MPIEIKELVIRASVANSEKGGKSLFGSSGKNKEAIVRECVDKVMEIINDKKER